MSHASSHASGTNRPIQPGERLPEATFKVKTADGLADRSSADIFKGKRVVLFAVPGAFTPTCNAKHLPSFVANHDAIKAKGVDSIVCVAVNDAFVLDAWAKIGDVGDKITMLADGNAEFTKAIGLDFDASAAGLGTRSRRYAMIVEDGVVQWIGVEESPGMMEVSGADQVLANL